MTVSHHSEWLSLMEVSGPFLVPSVLEGVFPQGLDTLESAKRQRIRRAYDEWRDVIDEADPLLGEIHREWIRLILADVLEYDVEVLKPRESVPESFTYRAAEMGVEIGPDLAVMAGEEARLLIKVYPPGTDLETSQAGDGWPASPSERMTLLCRASGVRLGLITDGERWMLVNAPVGATAGYASWYARLWRHEPITLQAFQALLGVRRFFGPAEEKLEALLEESFKHQEEVTDTLGEQVRRAVEVLIQALDRADIDRNRELLHDVRPEALYEAGLTVMMRLVFLLCAEERGLLLLGEPVYDQCYAVSTLRSQLREEADRVGLEVLERRQDAWSRLLAVFRAVYGGIEHETLRMPALGGSLFDPDRYPFLEGRDRGTSWRETPATPLPIDNRTVLMLLQALQVLEQSGGAMLLSYRALDVEQIGHVYEGLLEHTVTRLPQTTLGLIGSQRAKDPNAALRELESARLDGERVLVNLLLEKTGRSEPTLRNALQRQIDEAVFGRLLQACGGDIPLATRVRPFAHLLRADSWGNPLVYRANAFAVTLGTDRRETGTHYTPKSLTEAIVAETLEPVAYVGPSEGRPREEWELRTSAELLDLKICDLAMGSGAFLVQVCRWLAERLVEAWGREEKDGWAVSVEGSLSKESGGFDLLPKDIDERVLIARRLIAERCLYGVDMNPQAVELAKLSIWLVTLAKGRPFGFLDHNLRHGDSLLGIHRIEQLTELAMAPLNAHGTRRLFAENIERSVSEAIERRIRLRETPIRDIRDVEFMVRLDAEASRILEAPGQVADAMIGSALEGGDNDRAVEADLSALSIDAGSYFEGDGEVGKRIVERAAATLAVDLHPGKRPRKPFHWPLEFPEVFARENPGFDAIVGNPPYLGGPRITGVVGTAYREYLVRHLADGSRGSANLVVYFFLRSYQLLRRRACLGLLAARSIAEGDTRQVGLERLLKTGAVIYAAYPNEPWPGSASVITSRIHITKGEWSGYRILSGNSVDFISAFLSDQEEWSPKPLRANLDKSFIGSYVLGKGFILTEEKALSFIERDPKNREVLFPYLNGDDMNSHPEQQPSRWIINFWDWPLSRSAAGSWITAKDSVREKWLREGMVPENFPGRVAEDYPEILRVIEETVKPERQRKNSEGEYVLRKPLPQRWWHYSEKRPALYHAIGRGHSFCKHPKDWHGDVFLSHIIAFAQTSKTKYPAIVENEFVFDQKLVIIASQSNALFAVLCSNFHYFWAITRGGSMRTDAVYTPTDVFEPFPFPLSLEDRSDLEAIGLEYDQARSAFMKEKGIGLTTLYNRFHDPNDSDQGIVDIRDLHSAIDSRVAAAYGWDDLRLDHDFYEVSDLPESDRVRYAISEPARLEALRRLSQLNRERFDEETLHDANATTSSSKTVRSKRASKNKKGADEQSDLFATREPMNVRSKKN